MEFRRLRRKLNMIKAAALVSLAAALCLAGCSNTQPAAPSHTFDTALPLEEMGKLCYYRDERDAQFDADMEIVEGRIDAMTDGNYLKEETELEAAELDALLPPQAVRPMHMAIMHASAIKTNLGFPIIDSLDLPNLLTMIVNTFVSLFAATYKGVPKRHPLVGAAATTGRGGLRGRSTSCRLP